MVEVEAPLPREFLQPPFGFVRSALGANGGSVKALVHSKGGWE